MTCCTGQRPGQVAPARREAASPAAPAFVLAGDLPLDRKSTRLNSSH